MKRVLLYSPTADKYIGPTRFGYGAIFTRAEAELFPEDEVQHVTRAALGERPQYQVQEPTLSEIKAWAGRRGGKKTSPEKTRAVRRNGRIKHGDK